MIPALLSVLPSLQRIKFLTCTCQSVRASCYSAGTGREHQVGVGLFKAPPQRLVQPGGPGLYS